MYCPMCQRPLLKPLQKRGRLYMVGNPIRFLICRDCYQWVKHNCAKLKRINPVGVKIMDVRFCKAAIHEVDTCGNKSTISGEAMIIKLGDQAELCFFQGNKFSPGYSILKRVKVVKPSGVLEMGCWRDQSAEGPDIVDITFEE